MVGLYEEAFEENLSAVERQKLLEQFAIWALLKKEVSANFVAEVLDVKEENVLDFIAAYSKWFNSPEPGKYQLYHERLRVFLLQKLSEKEVQILHIKLIDRLEKAIEEKKADEFEKYGLEFLGSHLINEVFDNKTSYRFYQFFKNDKKNERQKFLSNSFIWTKNDLELSIKYSFYNDSKKMGFNAAINLLKIQNLEQNSYSDVLLLLDPQKYDLLLEKLAGFEGIKKSKIILLILHELLLIGTDRYSKDYTPSIVCNLLDIFIENEKENNINWIDYYPVNIIYKYQQALYNMGIEKYVWWSNFEVNLNEIIDKNEYDLNLLLNIINNNTQSGNYINNIRKLINNEVKAADFNRIKIIINAINKDGIENTGFNRFIINEKVDKITLKILNLNSIIKNNLFMRDKAIEMQKDIINASEPNNLKLFNILKVTKTLKKLKLEKNLSNYCSIILNLIGQLGANINVKTLLDLHSTLDQDKMTSEEILFHSQKCIEAKINSDNKLELVITLISIYKLLNNIERITYWNQIQIELLEDLISKQKNLKPRRPNPIPIINPLHKKLDYNALLLKAMSLKQQETYFEETKSKERKISKAINKIQNPFELILAKYIKKVFFNIDNKKLLESILHIVRNIKDQSIAEEIVEILRKGIQSKSSNELEPNKILEMINVLNSDIKIPDIIDNYIFDKLDAKESSLYLKTYLKRLDINQLNKWSEIESGIIKDDFLLIKAFILSKSGDNQGANEILKKHFFQDQQTKDNRDVFSSFTIDAGLLLN